MSEGLRDAPEEVGTIIEQQCIHTQEADQDYSIDPACTLVSGPDGEKGLTREGKLAVNYARPQQHRTPTPHRRWRLRCVFVTQYTQRKGIYVT